MRLASWLFAALFVSWFLVAGGNRADEKEDDAKREKEMEALLKLEDEKSAETEFGIKMRKRIAEIVDILGKAERIEVFRIDPRPLPKDERGKKAAISDHEIQFQTTVEKAETRKEIGDFLSKILNWNQYRMALCFNPRHAVRATAGTHTVELVICFECWRAQAAMDGMPSVTFPLLKSDGGPIARLVAR